MRYTEEGIELEWTPLADSDLAGYHMYRADAPGGGSFAQVNAALLGPASFRFTDRSPLPNTEYLYQLQAIDSTGNTSPFSQAVSATLYRPDEQAGALQLSMKNQKRKKTNRLEWAQAGKPDGSVRGYMVYRGTTERAMKPLSDLITTGNTFTDRALTHETYVYQVRAYTTSGQTIYSPLVEWKQR